MKYEKIGLFKGMISVLAMWKKLFFHGDVVYISNSKSNYRTTLLHIIWRQEKYISAIKR